MYRRILSVSFCLLSAVACLGGAIMTSEKTGVDLGSVDSGKGVDVQFNRENFAQVSVSNDKIDFKQVAMGKRCSQTIKLKNTGTNDLRIIEASQSPEVSLDFAAKTVAPGKAVEVVVSFRALQAGRHASFVKIKTNAHRQRTLIVKIQAEVTQ